jgi:hypothetical protein
MPLVFAKMAEIGNKNPKLFTQGGRDLEAQIFPPVKILFLVLVWL